MNNIGTFMFNVLKILVSLPSKLYEALYYQVSIKWLSKIINFFGAEIDFPSSVSLIALLGVIGGGTLVAIIIYNIFKL